MAASPVEEAYASCPRHRASSLAAVGSTESEATVAVGKPVDDIGFAPEVTAALVAVDAKASRALKT